MNANRYTRLIRKKPVPANCDRLGRARESLDNGAIVPSASLLLRSRPTARRAHPRRTNQYHAIHTGTLSTTA